MPSALVGRHRRGEDLRRDFRVWPTQRDRMPPDKPAAADGGGAGPSERRMSGVGADLGATVGRSVRRMSMQLMNMLGGGDGGGPLVQEPAKQENAGARMVRRASQTLASLFGGGAPNPSQKDDAVRVLRLPARCPVSTATAALPSSSHTLAASRLVIFCESRPRKHPSLVQRSHARVCSRARARRSRCQQPGRL